MPHVPGHKHAGHARLQQKGLPRLAPLRRKLSIHAQIRSGKQESLVVPQYFLREPFGTRRSPNKHKQRARWSLFFAVWTPKTNALEVVFALGFQYLSSRP